MSCNIAIAIRVASPGDSAGVVQTTGAGLASAAVNAAATAQNAAQAVLPLRPAPPPPAPLQQPSQPVVAPVPPLPPVPPDTSFAASPLTAAPPMTTASGITATFAVGDGSFATLTIADAPRRGAPGSFTWGAATSRTQSTSHASAGARSSSAGQIRSTVSVAVASSSLTVHEHRSAGRVAGATPRKRGATPPSLPSAPPLPSVPTPIVLAPGASSTHSTGNFTTDALAAGVAGLLLLILLAYAAPGLQTVRSRFAHVHPDPPG